MAEIITDRETILAMHDELTARARAIMVAKNNDYSGGNPDALANFRGSQQYGVHPAVGLLIRMGDKMMRVSTFARKGMLEVKDESVLDSVADMINYPVLLYGILKEDEAKLARAYPDGPPDTAQQRIEAHKS